MMGVGKAMPSFIGQNAFVKNDWKNTRLISMDVLELIVSGAIRTLPMLITLGT